MNILSIVFCCSCNRSTHVHMNSSSHSYQNQTKPPVEHGLNVNQLRRRSASLKRPKCKLILVRRVKTDQFLKNRSVHWFIKFVIKKKERNLNPNPPTSQSLPPDPTTGIRGDSNDEERKRRFRRWEEEEESTTAWRQRMLDGGSGLEEEGWRIWWENERVKKKRENGEREEGENEREIYLRGIEYTWERMNNLRSDRPETIPSSASNVSLVLITMV